MKRFLTVITLAGASLVSPLVFAQNAPAPGPMQMHAMDMEHPEFRMAHELKPIAKADFLKKAEKHFDEMDANHDGVVTPEELRAFHEKRMAGKHRGPEEMGRDKDGVRPNWRSKEPMPAPKPSN